MFLWPVNRNAAKAAAFLSGVHAPRAVHRVWREERRLAVRFGLNPKPPAATEFSCS
jgi:hypothetical protein